MSNPKISIITITFNSEKTLEETIKSVISQDYDNLEYLIIDGGSKDHTLDIVNKYRDKISFVISEPDKGISDAFNKGIKYTTGEIIGIINSDDVMLPGTLQAIANNYDENTAVYSMDIIIWDEEQNLKFRETPDLVLKLSSERHVAHQGRFIRKDAYEKYGVYDTRLRYMMDYDLLLRFYNKGLVFKHVKHDAALYRMGGATADNLFKKKNDTKITVQNNGGSLLKFYALWYHHVFRYLVKRFIIKVFGQKYRYSIRFKQIK